MQLSDPDIVKKYSRLVIYEANTVQADALSWLSKELRINKCSKVLDFGCGDGGYREPVQRAGGNWFGVDLISSPEIDQANKANPNRVVYDGRNLPFKNQSFDVIFSHQVLEHVQTLQIVFRELVRVCKPGGKLIGSTSHLEPYHSNSFRSITPYGLEKAMEEAGFQLQKIRAGVDCMSVICARIFPYLLPKTLSNLIKRIIWSPKGSPVNRLIHLWGKIRKIDRMTLECIKLQFSGHIVFQAIRI